MRMPAPVLQTITEVAEVMEAAKKLETLITDPALPTITKNGTLTHNQGAQATLTTPSLETAQKNRASVSAQNNVRLVFL